MKLLKTAFILSFVGITSAFAQDPVCQNKVERGGSIQVQMRPTGNGECFVSVHSFKTSGLVYRDYLFSKDGNFMVFNSYGDGSISETTGAREFFLFPHRNVIPQFKWNSETRRLEVTAVDGHVYHFDYETAEIAEISDAKVTVASSVNPNNRGGVEIKNYKGLILDAGFTMGRAPTENMKATSVFTDENGKTCKVYNGNIFELTSTGDVRLTVTDQELATFLKKRCPQIKFVP
ncbi:hypothetical protein [Bdellovibrio sp. BCCA]|uniref:hypothetical protein n=1 Tax=Bdellovibrio sp. BCCA TaxID=3136281 RepID=UPI0030EFB39B